MPLAAHLSSPRAISGDAEHTLDNLRGSNAFTRANPGESGDPGCCEGCSCEKKAHICCVWAWDAFTRRSVPISRLPAVCVSWFAVRCGIRIPQNGNGFATAALNPEVFVMAESHSTRSDFATNLLLRSEIEGAQTGSNGTDWD